MQIRFGYDPLYDCPQPTPMLLMLDVHYSRVADLTAPDHSSTDPAVSVPGYRTQGVLMRSRAPAPRPERERRYAVVVRGGVQPTFM